MKRPLTYAGLLLFLGLAVAAHKYLKQSEQDQEIIERANSLVWSLLGSQSSAKFLSPEIQELGEPSSWSVRGDIALRHTDGSNLQTRYYAAVIAQVCEPANNRECWQLKELAIDGQQVDLKALRQRQRAQADQQSETPPKDEADARPEQGGGEPAGPQRQSSTAAQPATASTSTAPQTTNRKTASESDRAEPAPEPLPEPAPTLDRREIVERIQLYLSQFGYDAGPIDGVVGPQTRTAIQRYQRTHNIAVDGEATMQLLTHLEQQR
ncbi:MAG: peptidoglycan-binding domain-containing protein [Kiloniellales bacterium]